MISGNTVRTFPCPECGAILVTGAARCDSCSTPIDAAVAEAAADQREKLNKAFAEANSLVLGARTFPIAFGLSFVPFIGLVGVAAVFFLLVQVPVGAYRWHRRFRALPDRDPDLVQARRWWKQSLLIWALALLACPIWMALRFGGQ